MIDYTNHGTVLELLGQDQEADSDRRDTYREVEHFLHKKDGQWEPEIIKKLSEASLKQHLTITNALIFGINWVSLVNFLAFTKRQCKHTRSVSK